MRARSFRSGILKLEMSFPDQDEVSLPAMLPGGLGVADGDRPSDRSTHGSQSLASLPHGTDLKYGRTMRELKIRNESDAAACEARLWRFKNKQRIEHPARSAKCTGLSSCIRKRKPLN